MDHRSVDGPTTSQERVGPAPRSAPWISPQPSFARRSGAAAPRPMSRRERLRVRTVDSSRPPRTLPLMAAPRASRSSRQTAINIFGGTCFRLWRRRGSPANQRCFLMRRMRRWPGEPVVLSVVRCWILQDCCGNACDVPRGDRRHAPAPPWQCNGVRPADPEAGHARYLLAEHGRPQKDGGHTGQGEHLLREPVLERLRALCVLTRELLRDVDVGLYPGVLRGDGEARRYLEVSRHDRASEVQSLHVLHCAPDVRHLIHVADEHIGPEPAQRMCTVVVHTYPGSDG